MLKSKRETMFANLLRITFEEMLVAMWLISSLWWWDKNDNIFGLASKGVKMLVMEWML